MAQSCRRGMVALQDDRWLLLVAAGLLIVGLGGIAWMASDSHRMRPIQEDGAPPSPEPSLLDRSEWQELGQLMVVLGAAVAVLPAFKLGVALDEVAGSERYEARGHTVVLGLGVGLALLLIATSTSSWGLGIMGIVGASVAVVGALAVTWLVDGVGEVAGLRRARRTTWLALAVALLGGLLVASDTGREEVAWGLVLGIPALLLVIALLDAWWNGFD